MSSLLPYFALTFVFSWSCWLAAAAMPRFGAPGDAPVAAIVLTYIGTFAPSLVALAMTARAGGDGMRRLLQGIVRADVPTRWYAFALAWFPAVKFAAFLLHRVTVGSWPRFGDLPLYLFIGAIAISTPIQAGEEIGWRGYALPRLASRLGLGGASLAVGAIWALWHLPLFFMAGADNHGESFTLFVIAVTALSVAMAWLYVRTGASLLLVMLMHSTVNQTAFILPSANPRSANPFAMNASLVGWLTVVFLWIGAAFLLVRLRELERSGQVAKGASAHRPADQIMEQR
jgi:membrane protease YdiL (CAAX protease family)